MTPEVKQAIESIKPLAHGYKAVLVIAAELERIGDLDTAIGESERRLATVRGQYDKVAEELETAKRQVEEARAKAESTVQRGTRDARDIVSAAEKEAALRFDDTKASADAVREKYAASAKDTVEKALGDAAQIRKLAEDGAAAKAAEVAEATNVLEAVCKDLAAKSAELSAVESKLTAARARMAELLR